MAASSWRGLLASDDSSTRWHVRFAREDDDRGSRFGDLAAFLKLDNNSPGRSWQPGLRVCLFDQLETFFSVNNQFAQNGDDARLVSNPESSSQSSDPMTQPNFLFLKLHDTPPIRWPPSMAGIIALVQRLW